MKYPAIYKSVEGSEYLYQNKDSYYCYERQLWDSSEPHHDCHHFDKNITNEYLANTYGEVKSKEHAEFIVRLAEVNQFKLNGSTFDFEIFDDVWFCFDEDELYFYNNIEDANDLDEKQITIPLPPECEESPEQVIAIGKMFSRTSDGLYRWVSDCGLMEIVRDLDVLKEADDFVIVSYESGSDEWPKVGSIVTWGNCSYTAEVIAIHNNMAWVFTEGEYHNEIAVSKLQKPKTPEQELNDELYELCLNHCDSKFQASEIARKLMVKYNITKKGKGDE